MRVVGLIRHMKGDNKMSQWVLYIFRNFITLGMATFVMNLVNKEMISFEWVVLYLLILLLWDSDHGN